MTTDDELSLYMRLVLDLSYQAMKTFHRFEDARQIYLQREHTLDEEILRRAIFEEAEVLVGLGVRVARLVHPDIRDLSHYQAGEEMSWLDGVQQEYTVPRGHAVRKIIAPHKRDVVNQRKIRNYIEHFDEHLDRFMAEIRDGSRDSVFIADLTLGPAAPSTFYWRRLDGPDFTEFHVFDEHLNLEKLSDDLRKYGVTAGRWITGHESGPESGE